MIQAINSSQFMPRMVMSGTMQQINKGANEEASESPSTRIAEVQRNGTGHAGQLPQSGLNSQLGQNLDTRA